jgi:hypothetical protein
MEWDGTILHHATQNGVQFYIHEQFISGTFLSVFLEHSWLQVTETVVSETSDKARLLHSFLETHFLSLSQDNNKL